MTGKASSEHTSLACSLYLQALCAHYCLLKDFGKDYLDFGKKNRNGEQGSKSTMAFRGALYASQLSNSHAHAYHCPSVSGQ